MTYADGSILRDGDSFYYPNGRALLRRGRTAGASFRSFYPNGRAIIDTDASVWYADGAPLADSATDELFYPDGQSLRRYVPGAWSEGEFRYASGAPFKKDGSIFYPTGEVAVADGKYFLPDGTEVTRDAFVFPSEDMGGKVRVFDQQNGLLSLYTIFRPLAEFAPPAPPAAGVVWPDIALHYLEEWYKPQMFVTWQRPNYRISVSVWGGHGPLSCRVVVPD